MELDAEDDATIESMVAEAISAADAAGAAGALGSGIEAAADDTGGGKSENGKVAELKKRVQAKFKEQFKKEVEKLRLWAPLEHRVILASGASLAITTASNVHCCATSGSCSFRDVEGGGQCCSWIACECRIGDRDSLAKESCTRHCV